MDKYLIAHMVSCFIGLILTCSKTSEVCVFQFIYKVILFQELHFPEQMLSDYKC